MPTKGGRYGGRVPNGPSEPKQGSPPSLGSLGASPSPLPLPLVVRSLGETVKACVCPERSCPQEASGTSQLHGIAQPSNTYVHPLATFQRSP